MKNVKIKRLLLVKEKENGNILDFVPILTGIVIVIIMMVISASWNSNINKKSDIDIIMRKYVLKMEASGYLTSGDKQELITELREAGLSNPDLTGTTETQLGYGKLIYLHVSGELEVLDYQWTNLFEVEKATTTIPYDKTRSTTAKY